MKKVFQLLVIAMVVAYCMPAMAQRAMTPDDLGKWQTITARDLSGNGQYMACTMSPWWGDSRVLLYSTAGELKQEFALGDQFKFSKKGDYLVVREKVAKEVVDKAKLKKVKKEKMPMPKLVIYNIATGKSEVIDSLSNYEMSESWLAYHRTHKDSTLYVRTLDGVSTKKLENVSSYGFAKKSNKLWYVVGKKKGSEVAPGLYVLDPEKDEITQVKSGAGSFSQVTFSDDLQMVGFLYSAKKKDDYKNTELWLKKGSAEAQKVLTQGDAALAKGWVVSKYSRVRFSDNGKHLYFGTSPEPLQKDSAMLDENRPNVHVWSYNEPVQYTVQMYDLKQDLRKNYTAVLHVESGKVVQLADEQHPGISMARSGNAEYALLSDSRPYSNSSMWEGRSKSDYYSVNINDGSRRLISKADYARFRMSPTGKYAIAYNDTDSCWYTITIADGQRHRLSTPATFEAWDVENDLPDYPNAYGMAGWTADDKNVLIYDRFDVWQFDPMGEAAPVNLTKNGRQLNLQYRYVALNADEHFVNLQKPVLLHGYNVVSRDAGYYSLTMKKGKSAVSTLIEGPYIYREITKAKDCDVIVYTEESYTQYPDFIASDLTFKKRVRLTEGYKQQAEFKWGKTELVHWTTPKGVKLDGILYYPDGFDASKKYPMIVNFYERYSETLHNYRMPQPHRSTVDYHMYNSNDYVMFCPDVRYSVQGTPGEDCYDCVMSGIQMIVDRGFIDEKRIGAQGHSWGGYQVAYLATRTDKFAAIESGAPVVNMYSAYGGIRWGSGKARAFQYEHTQSRIGGSIWEVPELYKANSPLFNMDKVTTPILIMHNDSDGHVPWYQGIEYFVAMKRNQKPCWLLNYTGEPHWPLGIPNRMDFQRRMKQFFDHFLKGEPMPAWMSEGVPAVKQPYELGY